MDKRWVQLDVDSYFTYARSRSPAWLDDLREEVTKVSPIRTGHSYSCARRRRSALPITETELKLIAAAAIIGLSRIPKKG